MGGTEAPDPWADSGWGRGILTLDIFSGPQPGEKTREKQRSPGLGCLQRAKDLGVGRCGRAGSTGHPQGPRQGLCVLWAAEVVRCS